ncbi:MAG: hypothetical protein KDB03_17390 [Planctomycetales bacterium]|nr:hypothetical protein [Planctomycetales bacterium]
MFPRMLIACWAVLLISLNSVNAQPPERGNPFFDALRESSRDGRREIIELLNNDGVKSEVVVSDELLDKIRDQGGKVFSNLNSLKEKVKGKSKTEIIQLIKDARRPYEEEVRQWLGNESWQRLREIYVQHRQTRAVLNDDIAVELKISPERLELLREFRDRTWRELMHQQRFAIERKVRHGESVREIFKSCETTLNSELEKQLTETEKADLKLLQGTPFDTSEIDEFSFSRTMRRGGERRKEPHPDDDCPPPPPGERGPPRGEPGFPPPPLGPRPKP